MLVVGLDSGTTSTRAWAMEAGDVVGSAQARIGARDVAGHEDREWLADRVREVATEALREADTEWGSVEAVVAFGMITSELGLEEVPHLEAPIGLDDLASGMVRTDRWFPVPLYLVPGVRSPADHYAEADFMRGEETEVIGVLAEGHAPPFVLISPGSHTKFVVVDDRARIVWSFTTLTGELIWALHQETILSNLLDPSRHAEDHEAVEEGARLAAEYGLSRALFSARVRNRLDGADPERCSDFIHGALGGSDLQALERARERHPLPGTILITDTSPLTDVYRHLLEAESWVESVKTSDRPLGARGAWELFRRASIT